MLRNPDASRSITSLLPNAIKGGYAHRTLLAFNAASLHDFILRSKTLDAGTVAYLLPALLEPLQNHSSEVNFSLKDSIVRSFSSTRHACSGNFPQLGSYILLSALSQKCHLTPKAVKAIIGAMAGCAHQVETRQFINAAISVCEPQAELDHFSNSTVKHILRLP
jgi:U3 small nucleolar RNA-associated protein 10